jgi:undecaprenyl-diphosphatase
MPDWLAIVLLGVIEGVTEFLPVSSTGHLLLVENSGWLPHQTDVFNIVIQSAAVLAVLAAFWQRTKQLVFGWREPATRDYALKLLAAFVVTSAGGLVLKKLHFKLPETTTPVAVATLVGGVLFLVVEAWLKGKRPEGQLTWGVALFLGGAQLLAAVFPGTSRSGATILMGLALGLSRPAATEFSFFLGVPTLLAAGAVQTLGVLRHPSAEGVPWGAIGLAGLVAAVTAFAVVRWLLRFVQTHTFNVFGWYRIVLAVVILIWASQAPAHPPASAASTNTVLQAGPGAR